MKRYNSSPKLSQNELWYGSEAISAKTRVCPHTRFNDRHHHIVVVYKLGWLTNVQDLPSLMETNGVFKRSCIIQLGIYEAVFAPVWHSFVLPIYIIYIIRQRSCFFCQIFLGISNSRVISLISNIFEAFFFWKISCFFLFIVSLFQRFHIYNAGLEIYNNNKSQKIKTVSPLREREMMQRFIAI